MLGFADDGVSLKSESDVVLLGGVVKSRLCRRNKTDGSEGEVAQTKRKIEIQQVSGNVTVSCFSK